MLNADQWLAEHAGVILAELKRHSDELRSLKSDVNVTKHTVKEVDEIKSVIETARECITQIKIDVAKIETKAETRADSKARSTAVVISSLFSGATIVVSIILFLLSRGG